MKQTEMFTKRRYRAMYSRGSNAKAKDNNCINRKNLKNQILLIYLANGLIETEDVTAELCAIGYSDHFERSISDITARRFRVTLHDLFINFEIANEK